MKLLPPLAIVCAGLLCLAWPAAAQKSKLPAGFEGRVVRVIDGATLVVRLADKTELTVRLRQIDPPELCQAGGAVSKQALIDVALGQMVQVQAPLPKPLLKQSPQPLPAPPGPNSQRLLATVMFGDVNLSRRQVEEGQAWSQRERYDRGPLVKEERMAKALRRGLHAAGGGEPPEEFRRRNGPCPS